MYLSMNENTNRYKNINTFEVLLLETLMKKKYKNYLVYYHTNTDIYHSNLPISVLKKHRKEQFYKVYLINEKRKSLNKKYDVIIRMRSDYNLLERMRINKCKKNEIYLYGTEARYEEKICDFTWDGFSYGNEKIMDIYCQFCFYSGNLKNKELHYCEAQLMLYLKSNNISIKYLTYKFDILNRNNNDLNYHIDYGRLSWLNKPPTYKAIEISEKYKNFAEKYSEIIRNMFNNNENCNTIQHLNNKKFIKRINDMSLFMNDIKKIINNYSEYYLYRLNIYRHYKTDTKSNRGSDKKNNNCWNAEMWHVDGGGDGIDVFKIMIYLNDVNENGGPMEYLTPLTYSNNIGKRFPYAENGKKIIGKKGTTVIFYPYIIHKGNYCKNEYRDTLNLAFCLDDKIKSGLSDEKYLSRKKEINKIIKMCYLDS